MNSFRSGSSSNVIQTNGKKKSYGLTFDDVKYAADFLLSQTKHLPKIGIVCGSGLGGLADLILDPEYFDYKEIPNFPVSTVPGHAGRLVFGELNGQTVVCMQGRVHAYEGYPMWRITFPIRVMKLLGVEVLIATNACGGLNEEYDVGDLMIIKDHINLPGMSGTSPLIGPNDVRFGPRFPAMSEAYDPKLRKLAKKVGDDLGFDFVREGVYVMQVGPCFETVTECKMLRNMGADVTGMSTVPEIIVARHCGMKCIGMSLITNKCITQYDADEKANHEEVLDTGRMRSKDLQMMVARIVGDLDIF